MNNLSEFLEPKLLLIEDLAEEEFQANISISEQSGVVDNDGTIPNFFANLERCREAEKMFRVNIEILEAIHGKENGYSGCIFASDGNVYITQPQSSENRAIAISLSFLANNSRLIDIVGK